MEQFAASRVAPKKPVVHTHDWQATVRQSQHEAAARTYIERARVEQLERARTVEQRRVVAEAREAVLLARGRAIHQLHVDAHALGASLTLVATGVQPTRRVDELFYATVAGDLVTSAASGSPGDTGA